MTGEMRHLLADTMTSTALVGLMAFVAVDFTSTQVGDYVPAEAVQNPAPAIQALADGSVSGFVDLHPVMGSSLFCSAPRSLHSPTRWAATVSSAINWARSSASSPH